MGGGLIQLIAYGAQDMYLTGNPQITFFKVVYRRHTNFSIESIQQTIEGDQNTGGGKGEVKVFRSGDLIHKIYVTSSTSGITAGDDIVQKVVLQIGDDIVDTQEKEWNQIWSELTTPESKALGFKNMTGSISNNLSKTGTLGVDMVQVPLHFWFCRNPGLALPIIALQYNEVKLLFTWGSSVGTSAECKVFVDYVYLDTDERRRFSQVSHEYLIEQIQRQPANSNGTINLDFNHPIKEIIWTSSSTNTYGTAQLKFNGLERFSSMEEEYFQLRQPIDHHTSVPGMNIVLDDNPKMLNKPINFFGNIGISTVVSIGQGLSVNKFKVEGSTGIISYMASNDPGIRLGDIIAIDYNFTNKDSVAGGSFSPFFQVSEITTAYVDDSTTAVFKVNSESNQLVDSLAGNGSIYIVGRVDDRKSRCSKLDKKINLYSFALKPEEHQPSGSCNFSRLDNAKLSVSTASGLSSSDNIYAINYNVLRIMSGMAGLAYSN